MQRREPAGRRHRHAHSVREVTCWDAQLVSRKALPVLQSVLAGPPCSRLLHAVPMTLDSCAAKTHRCLEELPRLQAFECKASLHAALH